MIGISGDEIQSVDTCWGIIFEDDEVGEVYLDCDDEEEAKLSHVMFGGKVVYYHIYIGDMHAFQGDNDSTDSEVQESG